MNVPVNHTRRIQLEQLSDEELIKILASGRMLHNITDTSNRKRMIRAIEINEYYANCPDESNGYPQLNPLIIGLTAPRGEIRQRITFRLKQRLELGLTEEARKLSEQ